LSSDYFVYFSIEYIKKIEVFSGYSQESIDLVNTDIIMPEKEGLETIRELKRDFPDVKIIAISGGASIEAKDYLKMAKQFGAMCTLVKPIEREALLEEIQGCLS